MLYYEGFRPDHRAKSSGLDPAVSKPQAANMFVALMASEAEEDKPNSAQAGKMDRESDPICPKDHSTDCTQASGEDCRADRTSHKGDSAEASLTKKATTNEAPAGLILRWAPFYTLLILSCVQSGLVDGTGGKR